MTDPIARSSATAVHRSRNAATQPAAWTIDEAVSHARIDNSRRAAQGGSALDAEAGVASGKGDGDLLSKIGALAGLCTTGFARLLTVPGKPEFC